MSSEADVSGLVDTADPADTVTEGDTGVSPDASPALDTGDQPDAPDATETPDTVATPDAVTPLDTSVPPVPSALVVVAGARACEVRISDPSGHVSDVVFAEGVLGRAIRQGDQLAISFLRKADADLTTGAATLDVVGGDLAGITLSRGACFDRTGAALPSSAPVLP